MSNFANWKGLNFLAGSGNFDVSVFSLFLHPYSGDDTVCGVKENLNSKFYFFYAVSRFEYQIIFNTNFWGKFSNRFKALVGRHFVLIYQLFQNRLILFFSWLKMSKWFAASDSDSSSSSSDSEDERGGPTTIQTSHFMVSTLFQDPALVN